MAPNRHDELIEVAARLFFDKGYDRTSVRDIANAVGITSGSIFYHFKTKEDLLAAVLEVGMRQGMNDVLAALSNVAGARRRLRTIIHHHLLALHGPHGHYHHIWLREIRWVPQELATPLKNMSRDYRELWLEVIDAVIKDGLTRTEPHFFRKMAIGALNWTSLWVHKPTTDQIDQLADSFLSAFLNETPPGQVQLINDFGHLRGAEAWPE